MLKKILLPVILIFTFFNQGCDKEKACEIAEKVNYVADIIIEAFTVATGNAIVNTGLGTAVTVKNLLLEEFCEDEQKDSGKSFSDYQVFFREKQNDDWILVQTGNQFEVASLSPDETFKKENEVIFTQIGQYYLNVRADIGEDIIEKDEDNNEKRSGEITGSGKTHTSQIINVIVQDNSDFELIEKLKAEKIYVLFK